MEGPLGIRRPHLELLGAAPSALGPFAVGDDALLATTVHRQSSLFLYQDRHRLALFGLPAPFQSHNGSVQP